MQTIEDLAIRGLKSLASISFPPGEADDGVRAAAAAAGYLRDLLEQLRSGLSSPLVVAIFGGTGVGKSTFLNTLANSLISPVSVKRPCTYHPLVFHHERAAEAVAAERLLSEYPRRAAGGETPAAGGVDEPLVLRLHAHRIDWLARAILIDTPDFDSVERRNKATVADIFRRAELVLFVTNPARYADDEQWRFLRQAGKVGKPIRFLFNRAEGEEAPSDFEARLREAGIEGELVRLPWQAGAVKRGLLKGRAVQRSLVRWMESLLAEPHHRECKQRALGITIMGFKATMETELLPAVSRARLRHAALEKAIREAFNLARESLDVDLHGVVGQETKERLDLLVRENIRKLADPLGGVRRAVLAPIRMIGRWVAGSSSEEGPLLQRKLRREIRDHHQRNREAVWREVERLGIEFRRRAVESGAEEILLHHDLTPYLLERQDVYALYEDGKDALKQWLAQRFQELTGKIRGQRSWQLATVQALWVSLILAFEFGTGGGFAAIEGLINLVVFPMISPLLIKALSLEEFKALTREAGRRHEDLCQEILARQRRRLTDWLRDGFGGLEPAEELIAAYRLLKEALWTEYQEILEEAAPRWR
jgi:energy-coupling factor transporter ATP-binding protein EcfA2